MGGWGSGRRWNKRDTTDDMRRLDVRWLERHDYLKDGHAGSLHWSSRGERTGTIDFRVEADRIHLSYKQRQRGETEWESLAYPVFLDRTPCHYGGSRSWFLCPAKGCLRRVAILYGGRIFACRNCYGLAYSSQQENPSDRAADRAWAILKRLRCDQFTNIFDTEPPRPSGMHVRTYERLMAKYRFAQHGAFAGIAMRLRMENMSE
jgi:hypothetical protein